MIRVLLQCVLSVLIAAAAWAWYGSVAPQGLALALAVLIGGALLVGMIAGNLSFKSLIVGGPVFIVWPAGALLASWGWRAATGEPLAWATGLGWGWAVPLIAWKVHHSMAEKRDRARDWGGLTMGAIMVYTVAVTLYAAEPWAIAGASLGVGATILAARQQLLIPPLQEAFMGKAAALSGLLFVVLATRAAIF